MYKFVGEKMVEIPDLTQEEKEAIIKHILSPFILMGKIKNIVSNLYGGKS